MFSTKQSFVLTNDNLCRKRLVKTRINAFPQPNFTREGLLKYLNASIDVDRQDRRKKELLKVIAAYPPKYHKVIEKLSSEDDVILSELYFLRCTMSPDYITRSIAQASLKLILHAPNKQSWTQEELAFVKYLFDHYQL